MSVTVAVQSLKLNVKTTGIVRACVNHEHGSVTTRNVCAPTMRNGENVILSMDVTGNVKTHSVSGRTGTLERRQGHYLSVIGVDCVTGTGISAHTVSQWSR